MITALACILHKIEKAIISRVSVNALLKKKGFFSFDAARNASCWCEWAIRVLQ